MAEKIVRMRAEHIGGVHEIELECFCEPWSEESLGMLVREGGVGFAVVSDGVVAAYGGMLCVAGEGQVTNVAVLSAYRRRGFGRLIVGALIEYARENGLTEIYLEVRESNVAAQALYESYGFECVGRRKNFYRNPREDCLNFCKRVE